MTDQVRSLLEDGVLGEGVRLDLGAGDAPAAGFIGVDRVPSPWIDIVLDLENTPYPIPSECAVMLLASHIVEHFKPWLFIDIMNEWWRILKPQGELIIATPYAGSHGYWQDPTHVRGFNETSFLYFDPLHQKTQGQLYQVYRPLPWEVKEQHWDMSGNLEAKLVKRRDDPSYHEIKRAGV